jgi:hypothetical protein
MDFEHNSMSKVGVHFHSTSPPSSVLKCTGRTTPEDGGEMLRRFLKSRPGSSSPENKIIKVRQNLPMLPIKLFLCHSCTTGLYMEPRWNLQMITTEYQTNLQDHTLLL